MLLIVQDNNDKHGLYLHCYCVVVQDNNEAPVFSAGNHEFEDRLQVDGDEGVIHFRPLIKEDEGVYKCHAFNDAGEDFETGRLRVLSNLQYSFCSGHLENE